MRLDHGCSLCVERRQEIRAVYQCQSASSIAIWKSRTHVVSTSFILSAGPIGNSPLARPVSSARLSPFSSPSFAFSPPADFTSQHLTVESRLPDTSTDDSAENDREVMVRRCPVIRLIGRELPRSQSQILQSRPVTTCQLARGLLIRSGTYQRSRASDHLVKWRCR